MNMYRYPVEDYSLFGPSQLQLTYDDLQADSLYDSDSLSSPRRSSLIEEAINYPAGSSQDEEVINVVAEQNERERRIHNDPVSSHESIDSYEVISQIAAYQIGGSPLTHTGRRGSTESNRSDVVRSMIISRPAQNAPSMRSRISARRFYRRLRAMHLNRRHRTASFDQLTETQNTEILRSSSSSSTEDSVPGAVNRETIVSEEDSLNRQFDFTTTNLGHPSSLRTFVSSSTEVFPIRRDLDSHSSIRDRLHRLGTLLRRSRPLTGPPPELPREMLSARSSDSEPIATNLNPVTGIKLTNGETDIFMAEVTEAMDNISPAKNKKEGEEEISPKSDHSIQDVNLMTNDSSSNSPMSVDFTSPVLIDDIIMSNQSK